MFNEISWQSYWTTLTITLFIYYIVVCLFYYSKDLKQWLRQKSNEKMNWSPREVDEETEKILTDCMNEVSAFFELAKRNKCVKNDLIYALQNILKKYSVLDIPACKNLLNSAIATQCEHICSIRLSKDDVSRVWLDL